MKLQHISIQTDVMRKGKTLRDFFEECARCNVPGLPYVDDDGKVVGRISIRDVYKHMAIPDYVIQVAHVLGDQTSRIDLPEMKVLEAMASPVEAHILENITSVSPQSSVVKALAIMEMFNTSYIFLMEDEQYKGIVTRMVIARRMLVCLRESADAAAAASDSVAGQAHIDTCF
jgi:CBS domain-containing protein